MRYPDFPDFRVNADSLSRIPRKIAKIQTLFSPELGGIRLATDTSRARKTSPKEFAVSSGEALRLSDTPTGVKARYESKSDFRAVRERQMGELNELQSRLYAHNRYSLLLIFQAMDAAGKDSAIKHVMSGVNPQGCQVYSFKHPSAEELDHDFLWRTTRNLPERGRIGIFNRSYYEEVLIVRVHPEILRSQAMPAELVDERKIWEDRYRSIVDLENHLYRNGTRIVKFFLHISKEEQRKRFLKRIDDPEKNWKFSAADLGERNLWDKYMNAYEDCLSATSTVKAPWFVVPADDKKNTQLIIAEIIIETLKALPLKYPQPMAPRSELEAIRKLLLSEESAKKKNRLPQDRG
jgi:PPK2 family polyphosphate:nucleotide phosphotransferase